MRWSLAQDDLRSYQEAAEFLNLNNINMVCLQHEYGIFGGPAGSHILQLLRGLKMPVVTTLHSARGFGNTLPVASNDSSAGRQQNGRVELLVSGDAIGNPTNVTTRKLAIRRSH